MTQADMELLTRFSPEELQQMLGLGTLDERGALLDAQMQQAQALRRPTAVQRQTAGGAIGEGLGDLFRGIAGTIQEKDIGAQQAALLDKKDAGRKGYADAMVAALRAHAPVSALPLVAAPEGFATPANVAAMFGQQAPAQSPVKVKRVPSGVAAIDAAAQAQDDALDGFKFPFTRG